MLDIVHFGGGGGHIGHKVPTTALQLTRSERTQLMPQYAIPVSSTKLLRLLRNGSPLAISTGENTTAAAASALDNHLPIQPANNSLHIQISINYSCPTTKRTALQQEVFYGHEK